MTEKEIKKCLISYGFYPMTIFLKELEESNQFEYCSLIYNTMISFKQKHLILFEDMPTQYSEEAEKDYNKKYKNHKLIETVTNYQLSEIKKNLTLL